MASKKSMHPGYLIVMILLGILIAAHLCVAYYFLHARGRNWHIIEGDPPVVSTPASGGPSTP
jgi:hypothetical protein